MGTDIKHFLCTYLQYNKLIFLYTFCLSQFGLKVHIHVGMLILQLTGYTNPNSRSNGTNQQRLHTKSNLNSPDTD